MNISIQLRSYLSSCSLKSEVKFIIPGTGCSNRDIFGFLKPNWGGGEVSFLLTILDLRHFIGFLKRLIKSTINLEKGHNFETNPDFKKSSGSYRKHKNNRISLKCCNIIVHMYSTNLHTSLLPPTFLFSPYNAYTMNRLLAPESVHCLIDRKKA